MKYAYRDYATLIREIRAGNTKPYHEFCKECIVGPLGEQVRRVLTDLSLRLTVAPWSFALDQLLPLHSFSEGDFKKHDAEFERIQKDFSAAVKRFNFTGLLVENRFRDGVLQFSAAPGEGGRYHAVVHFEEADPFSVSFPAGKGQIGKLVDLLLRAGLERYSGGDLKNHSEPMAETFERVVVRSISKTTTTRVYFIPITTEMASQPVTGTLVLYCDCEIDLGRVRTLLVPFARGVISPYQMQELEAQRREAQIRSEVAKIMGRVNAHDVGHVLANARLPSGEPGGASGAAIDEEYFRHLTSYLRTRMVYAAEAAATDPSGAMVLPFYSQIISPFGWYTAPNLPGGKETSPVCRHIAESEGVTSVEVKVFLDGEQLEMSQDEGVWRCQPKDFYVTIPTGMVGVHALYCVLENVARNGAKYGAVKNEDKKLTLSLHAASAGFRHSESYYRLRVFEEHSEFNESYRDLGRYFPKPTITDKDGDFRFSSGEDWRIIDPRGQPSRGGYGIKEMRICAAWLRGEPLVPALESERDLPLPLLRPIRVRADGHKVPAGADRAEQRTYFGYELYLLKPKTCLIVDEKAPDEATRSELERRGVEFFTGGWSGALEQPSRHALAIFEGLDRACGASLETLRASRTRTASRLLIVSPKETDLGPIHSRPLPLAAEDYAKCREALQSGYTDDLARLYGRWAWEVLADKNERVTLVLHLNSRYDTTAPERVVEAWQEVASVFADVFDGKWDLVTHAGPGQYNASDAYTHGRVLIYDYHGCFGSNWPKKSDPHGNGFYEQCHKVHGAQPILFNPPSESGTRLWTALALAEAALARVAVVDERIWNRTRDSDHYLKALRRAGIFVPPGRGSTGQAGAEVMDYENPEPRHVDTLTTYLEEHRVHVLTIHQGLLDKIFHDVVGDPEPVAKAITAWRAKTPFVIVHSDRGGEMLARRPERTRFVPFSAIEPWLAAEEQSKYHLTQALLSATQP